MVPVDAWAIRPTRAMRETKRRSLLVRVVISSFKKIVRKIKEVWQKVNLDTPKIVRRVLKPFAQGPPK